LDRAQAARAAAVLRGHSIESIYCGPSHRAHETAQVIAATLQLTPEIIGGLEEIRVPALRTMTQSEVDSYFAAAARRKLQRPVGRVFQAVKPTRIFM